MRLAIVIPNLRCGGVQRAAINLTRGLLHRGHEVTLFTFSDAASDFFSPPPGAARVALGFRAHGPTHGLLLGPRTFQRLRALRSAVLQARPDVVIAHAPQINVPTLLSLRGSATPIIVTEHGDVPITEWKKAAWYRLRRLAYPSAYKVVSVSEAVDRNVDWLPRERRAVIPNPIAAAAATNEQISGAEAPLTVHGDFMAGMGRLSHAKGFDILIDAFALVAPDFPDWKLVIIGDGELREALEKQVLSRRLSERVIFTGELPQPFELLRQAKFFAMASRYEGFPLAHAEALACGLPVVAADCPSRPTPRGASSRAGGVRELIRRGVDGLLVAPEDPSALGRAMTELMSNPMRRRLLADHSRDVVARFAPEKVVEAWNRLLQDAVRSLH